MLICWIFGILRVEASSDLDHSDIPGQISILDKPRNWTATLLANQI